MWCDQPFSQTNMTIGRTMKVEFRGDSKVGGEGGVGGGWTKFGEFCRQYGCRQYGGLG